MGDRGTPVDGTTQAIAKAKEALHSYYAWDVAQEACDRLDLAITTLGGREWERGFQTGAGISGTRDQAIADRIISEALKLKGKDAADGGITCHVLD